MNTYDQEHAPELGVFFPTVGSLHWESPPPPDRVSCRVEVTSGQKL